jgi:O-antigen/teichoic acid export membrane protein
MLPLSLVGGMHIVQNQADIVMLGLFASSGEVGVYRAVTQSAALVVFFLTAINLAVGPYISQLYTAGDTERLQLLARNSARLILAFALPVASTFVLFGKEILVFAFGPDYGVGEVPLAMLCGGQIVNAATGPLGMLMNMTGNERDTARGTAVGVLSNILLNLLLIPQFGMNGAAAATAISVLVLNGILCRKLWLRTGICSVAIGVRVGRAKE